MAAPRVLPALLAHGAAQHPAAIALRYKRRGIWRHETWADYRTAVRILAAGLDAAGFRRGDRLLVVGEASPEWLRPVLAANWLGGIAVLPYPDGEEGEIAAAASATGARYAVVDTADRCEALRVDGGVAACFRLGPETEEGTLDRLAARGRERVKAAPGLLVEPSTVDASEHAVVAFTAGAGGRCRPIALSHAALVGRAERVLAALGPPRAVAAFCQVPFAHVAEFVTGPVAQLARGGTLSFPERTDTVAVDLAQAGSERFGALAWQWDRLAERLLDRMAGASSPARKSFQRSLEGRRGGVLAPLLRRILRGHLGFAKTGTLVCTGASPRPETERAFAAIGRPLTLGYGTTESAGWCLLRRPAGRWEALPGETWRLTGDGELSVGDEGHEIGTGDFARLSWETLTLTGPRRDATGLAHLPEIEAAIRTSRYVADAIARRAGAGVETVVIVNPAPLAAWARANGVDYTTDQALLAQPTVRSLVRDDALRLAQACCTDAAISVHVLDRTPTRRDGALTPSGTLRRGTILARLPQRTDEREAAVAVSR